MRVVAMVGLPGSGKSEAAAVAREAGIPVVTMGDVIRETCRDQGIPITEETMGEVATDLREQHGDAAIAQRSLPLIESHEASVVLVDGIRGIAEVEYFIEAFGDDFELVSIEVPFETRLSRIQERGRDPTAESIADLKRRDARELGYGMGEAMDVAEINLDNTDDLEAFRATIEAILLQGVPETADSER